MTIFESCPTLESERFLLRFIQNEDCDDLLKVYSDKNTLPFFNSDNCNGDNFYYPTKQRMAEAISFWIWSYKIGEFVRFSIIDKAASSAIGTMEIFYRVSNDAFDTMGLLRVDVRSDYEKEDMLYELFALITPRLPEMLGCSGVVTKAPLYAVERVNAVQKAGYQKSEHLLTAGNGRTYDGYWVLQ